MDITKLKKFFLPAIAVIVITALGFVLLLYDNARLGVIEEPTETVAAPVYEKSDGFAAEGMYVDGKLDINRADREALNALPGIGPTLAERIISYRAANPFKVTRDLKKVSGIGDATYEALSDLICVGAAD